MIGRFDDCVFLLALETLESELEYSYRYRRKLTTKRARVRERWPYHLHIVRSLRNQCATRFTQLQPDLSQLINAPFQQQDLITAKIKD